MTQYEASSAGFPPERHDKYGNELGATDPISLYDFMVTSIDTSKGILITGEGSPTARFHRAAVGMPSVGEQIAEALERGDVDTAHALHAQIPEQPK